ncbi:MAG: class I tRNA ligase family protein, partial [Armatimonadetes bacterium]|nr:class I tRNA ligase family protein [Armatimonadota bacterium]
AIRVGSEIYVVAEALLASFVDNLKLPAPEIIGKVNGKALEGAHCRHPFLDRDSVLVVQSYVTMDQGTGCVHTAPGHGQDDYEAALAYHLPILVPVDNLGFLTEEAGPFAGLFIEDANPKIIEHLQKVGFLLGAAKIIHSTCSLPGDGTVVCECGCQ